MLKGAMIVGALDGRAPTKSIQINDRIKRSVLASLYSGIVIPLFRYLSKTKLTAAFLARGV